jgi:glycine cleavage system H protein
MSELKIPTELYYTEEHEWVRKDEDGFAYIGITDFAQSNLGDIVYVEIDFQEGDEVSKDEVFGSIEAVKTVSDLIAPITCEVVEINEELNDAPDTVNSSPYEEGWILKVKINDSKEFDELLNSVAYAEITG